MKIGILTLPLHGNYGGNLQAFALMTYIKQLGHEPVLIHLKNETRGKPGTKALLKQYLAKTIKGIPFLGKQIISSRSIYRHSEYFIKKYIQPQTLPIKKRSDLKTLTQYRLDAYIVGSDQVWRKDYAREYLKTFFFDFVDNVKTKKISYAASFGVDFWQFDDALTTELKQLIHLFDLITVREDSAVDLCKEYFDIDVRHVIDPTMLLEPKDYADLIVKEKAAESPGDCMVYVLDKSEEKNILIDRIAQDGGFTCFTVNAASKDKKEPIAKRTYPPVTNWLKGFMDSKFVITDSFHGVAFSILFNKPFIAIGNEERGLARFTSIVNMFGLRKRFILSAEAYNKSLLKNEINWTEVNQTLELYRKKTLSLLHSHFN